DLEKTIQMGMFSMWRPSASCAQTNAWRIPWPRRAKDRQGRSSGGATSAAETDNPRAPSNRYFPPQSGSNTMKTRHISRRDALIQGSLAVAGMALLRVPGLADAFSIQPRQ